MCLCTLKNELIFLISNFNLFLSNVTADNKHQGDGPHCTAVFSLQSSAVCTLQFANHGGKLAVGYEHGQVSSSIISFSFLSEMVYL